MTLITGSRLTISVDFPALTDLVAYLRDNQQQKVDALAAQVQQLTAGLRTSSTGLQGSVDKEK